jgi:hypothetical protein
MTRAILVLFAVGLGCQPLEPLGDATIRVADGVLVPEAWFALPGGAEHIVARDPEGERRLLTLDGTDCSLGRGGLRAVVGREGGDDPEPVIASVAQGVLEVRDLGCAPTIAPFEGVWTTTVAFEHAGSFVMLILDVYGDLWRLDVLTGERAVIGQSTGAFGLVDERFGRIASGVQWTDGTGPDRAARVWSIVGGEVVVVDVHGREIGRAGVGVAGVRAGGLNPMWYWDTEGLKRWVPGEPPAELVVPDGCEPRGSNPMYVRAPCERGDLVALDVSTGEAPLVARDVVDHALSGDWLSYVTEVGGVRERVLVSTEGEARRIPEDSHPIVAIGSHWFLRSGAAILRLGPEGPPVEVLSDLLGSPTLLSDGRLLVIQGDDPVAGTLAAFDPATLAVDPIADGVRVGEVLLATASLTGRSVLIFRSHVVGDVGLLEAMLWPDGPRVAVQDNVTAYRPILTANPPSLLYSTGGDDPALWLIPI